MSSLFGQPAQSQQAGGGLFGGSLFGNTQQQTQPAPGGLFGAAPKPTSLFGQPTATNQPAAAGSLFGQPAPANQPAGGLFGASTTNNPPAATGSLFGGLGSQQQQNQQGGGLFGGSSTQQPAAASSSLFGSTQRPGFAGLGQSTPPTREKSIPDQIQTVVGKWVPQSPDCVFQHYFYNKVEEQNIPFYRPGPNEDPKAWEEALAKKPGPAYIPVLCTGYEQLGARIKVQQLNLAKWNAALHFINNKLTLCLQSHETSHSIRAMDAKRKHALLRQRCLRIATKVQVLRNRGYALGGDEEDLRVKLQELEKKAYDPGLGARGEEIWARMLTVQERARLLRNEIEKSGAEAPEMLDEETTKKAKKILEDYDRQLVHLKKELDAIQKEYEEWEKTQKDAAEKAKAASIRGNLR